MPGKVVIVLEAQDREALARIREFARGVEDTVGKLKAANPALEGTRVKVTQLTSAKVDAFKAAQQWQGALVLLPGQLGSVASQATSLVSVLGRAGAAGGLVGGLVAAGVAGASLLKSLSDDIERLDNLSRQTGLAVSSLQAFEQAAREAGESPETLVRAFGRVNDAINDVLMGTANAGKSFQAIGVDLRALVRDGASTEQILEATARALDKIPDPTRRAAAAQEILSLRGKAANAALTAIAKEGVDAYVQGMREAGIVTSEETNRMARAFDAMVDSWERSARGWLVKLKAFVAEAAMDWRKLGAPTPFPIPGSAMGDLSFPGERPPPQDARRETPDTPDMLAAAKAAEEQRLKAAIDVNESIRKSREDLAAALSEIDDRTRKAAQDAADAQRELDFSREWQAMDTAVKASAENLEDYTVKLGAVTAATDVYFHRVSDDMPLGEFNTALTENMALLEQQGLTLTGVTSLTAEFGRQLEGLPPTITETGDAADREFMRLRDLMDGAEGSVERLIGKVREAPAAISEFGAKWQSVIESMPTAIDNVIAAIQGSTVIIGQAFEESIFQLIKGNLDDFDDIWKAALDAVLRQIIAFLATTAVQELIKLGTEWARMAFSDGPEQLSGPSSGGNWWDDVKRIFGFGQQTQGATSGTGTLALEQARTDEVRQQLVFEQAKTASAKAGAEVEARAAGVAGAAATSGRGGFGLDFGSWLDIAKSAALTAVGFLSGGPIGAAIAAGKVLVEAYQRNAENQKAISAAMDQANFAGIAAVHAIDRNTATTVDLTAAGGAWADATADLTDVTVAATEAQAATTASMADLTSGLVDAGKALVDAVDAAHTFADMAADAAASAADSASSASDSARGFDTSGAGPAGDPGRGGGGVSPSAPDPNPPDPDHGGENHFQHGLLAGAVRRSGRATVHRGEVVATSDQAGALLAAIRGGMSGRTGERILAALLQQNEILRRGLAGGGRRAGAMV